ncbi:hypothetical protein M404DRAFT_1002904 [Pisolithus tinctorius Marx 270]|uniref:Uncharacterized protein n=1 Tax=Pisolithus tinctorius Marx 270 TaxID=870435 RepID=A0A0C3P3B2_PISTI|nr:hypothetical protein M404DRAFT_1002904 [Pisolithus tinctorius Marx 270]
MSRVTSTLIILIQVKVFPAVNQGWNMQDHASGHVVNHSATLAFPHTSLLPPYAMARSSEYSQANVDISIFGDLDHDSIGPMMGLSSIASFHDHIAGQVIDSNASGLSSQLSSLLQERYLSDDFNDNIRLPLKRPRTETAASDQPPFNFPRQLIKQWVISPIHLVQLIHSKNTPPDP